MSHVPLLMYAPDKDVALQVIYFLTIWTLPNEFVGIYANDPTRIVKGWHPFVCVAAGLWGGLIIGVVTEYYTSNRYTPVQVLFASWLPLQVGPEGARALHVC